MSQLYTKHPDLRRLSWTPRCCSVNGCDVAQVFAYVSCFDSDCGVNLCAAHRTTTKGVTAVQHVRRARGKYLPNWAVSGMLHENKVRRSNNTLESGWTVGTCSQIKAPFILNKNEIYVGLVRLNGNLAKHIPFKVYLQCNPTAAPVYHPEFDADLDAPTVKAWQKAFKSSLEPHIISTIFRK